MNAAKDRLDECVAALVASFPVEDIWLLEGGAARECALEKPVNLILIVPDDTNVHAIEGAAGELIRNRLEGSGMDVFVFRASALERTPRPLLVKMALTSGKSVYRR